MPLTQKITLRMAIQKECRLQIPRVVRSEFKIERGQVLKVSINALNLGKGWQIFYARVLNEGRLTISKIVVSQLQSEIENLTGRIFEIILEPPQG